ncbi:rhamnogalacturonyl hydrolase YesR [Flavobacterium sp. 270]|uniref:glycoside hydrolase family 88/105 protein n=1 Tax=Flavobacterium sp. 270 TaxID=2512114 RepID=UPI0010651DA6|nr:glycoside hydrolase family 88 protein [Flavobacterium sp. 270]TDW44649.1 rhamnogalacturonyl hydrolase YesR [Flavobacterium sp. 270]
MNKASKIITLCAFGIGTALNAQTNDVTTPLHAMQPDYVTPYVIPEKNNIESVLNRVYTFLEENTASKVLNASDNSEVTDLKKAKGKIIFSPGAFRLTSYEWGVTYAGMLLATEATGNKQYADYTNKRLKLISDVAQNYKSENLKNSPVHTVLQPRALDDDGALCAAFIKAKKSGLKDNVDPVINNFIKYITEKEYRLKDGTLARNRPLPNTLWLDDLFMSVPALAQMGSYTGDSKYFDDAVKQVNQFSERMFNSQKGLYMHGWVESMQVHPQFHWARANGWAVMTMVELLEVLPKNHPGYPQVLAQLQKHIAGLVQYQDGTGFWHQLIDRNDSYLETSATAIYTYAIARAINRGYIDKMAYSPAVLLAWNAVASKVNAKGEVEGTCVGTGMGFDPAFYYYRPINVFAAHGYGPVLLAGSEIILLLKNNQFEMNDSALQLKTKL